MQNRCDAGLQSTDLHKTWSQTHELDPEEELIALPTHPSWI